MIEKDPPTRSLLVRSPAHSAPMVRGAKSLLVRSCTKHSTWGAWGNVVKTRAATDLPAAVDAFLEGRQFVSAGLMQNYN